MIALKKWMDKTIWNIKISIWQYTVCGSHEIKNDPTYILVHLSNLVVNNSTVQVNTPGIKLSTVIIFNKKTVNLSRSGMAFLFLWRQFDGFGRILLLSLT